MPAIVATCNTSLEKTVERIAREMELNFHTHRGDLPSTPVLVFYESTTAVFAHGCFWHAMPAGRNRTSDSGRKKRRANPQISHAPKLLGFFVAAVGEFRLLSADEAEISGSS